jgi:hypothetical protein
MKYKCVDRDYEYVIQRLEESSFDSKVECNENEHKNCVHLSEKCEKICPIDCLRDDNFFTSYLTFHGNNNLYVYYYFWDSREAFISYEESADILLIDYFTYIGGLFGLWFGICLERLLNLIVKETGNLAPKVKLQVEKHLSFLFISSLSILHFFNVLIKNLMNSILEKVLFVNNKMIEFVIWFSDWLQFFIDMSLTHVRIWKFNAKRCLNTFFTFTINSMKLFIYLFLSLIFCSKSMFEIEVMYSTLHRNPEKVFIHNFFIYK